GVSGGSFTITYNGNLTTASNAWNSTPATLVANIQAALDAIFGAGNTVVSSTSATGYLIAFAGGLTNANLAQITTTSSLTGGTVTPTTVRNGACNEVQTVTPSGLNGTFTLQFNAVNATSPVVFSPSVGPTASQIQTHLNTIPALNGNVTVIGAPGG